MRDNKLFIESCEEKLKDKFKAMDDTAYFNQVKVLKAFEECRIALRHFNGSTGYGYDDEGRDTLGKLYALSFGAEAGIVSPHLLSGTHALTVALFGLLRPNDTLLCISGMPYDTIRGVIFGENNGSLKDFGVKFDYCELKSGEFDYKLIKEKLDKSVKVVYIQRSRGYELRDALSCEQIKKACEFVRKLGFNGCIFVDNCYGEFVETKEPTEVGADIIVGSLIKNAGGGLAPTGGYICGKQNYIDLIGKRLTAPSIGLEVGSYASGYQYFYQGLFMAPHTVAQALKSTLLIGQAMSELGYINYPEMSKTPYDITRAIQFDSAEKMINFIREVQYASPVDSYVCCEPWDMPGYNEKIIMAAGTFVAGSSIELSADGPVKPPYIVYFQGGLTYEHGKYALQRILEKL
ncbi:MAG: methionine gamma-lyase family protein [Clostridiales bacterium]|nr:methionine gamma-lyase family protein [Clostridiales bacterium]